MPGARRPRAGSGGGLACGGGCSRRGAPPPTGTAAPLAGSACRPLPSRRAAAVRHTHEAGAEQRQPNVPVCGMTNHHVAKQYPPPSHASSLKRAHGRRQAARAPPCFSGGVAGAAGLSLSQHLPFLGHLAHAAFAGCVTAPRRSVWGHEARGGAAAAAPGMWRARGRGAHTEAAALPPSLASLPHARPQGGRATGWPCAAAAAEEEAAAVASRRPLPSLGGRAGRSAAAGAPPPRGFHSSAGACAAAAAPRQQPRLTLARSFGGPRRRRRRQQELLRRARRAAQRQRGRDQEGAREMWAGATAPRQGGATNAHLSPLPIRASLSLLRHTTR